MKNRATDATHQQVLDKARAYQALDRAVDRCYRPQPFATELARLEFLFGLYQQLSAPLAPAGHGPAPKAAGRKGKA